MKLLWAVENEARGRSPEARLAARCTTSAAIVQSLFDLWERELPRISGKSKLAEAIRYARSQRAALLLFLDDGRVEIDSNIVERAIRPQAITRKNSLFAGSIGGGRTWASIGHHVANLQDERRRSLRLGEADPRTHCQPLAEQRHRRAHALEFQARRMNGAEKTLTIGARTYDALCEAAAETLKAYSPNECAAYIKNAGYA